MLKRKLNGMVVVFNDEVCWIDLDSANAGRCFLRIPLEQLLSSETIAAQIPKDQRGNYRTLCILPDHWFGIETYPFGSKRAALIEPFLERRLAAAYPELPQVAQFFNYHTIVTPGHREGIAAFFLQDGKAYQLYDTLRRLDLAPRWMTSPGFLWTQMLSKIVADFRNDGTLLIHMNGRECLLYFFFKGDYLFSRNVMISDAVDCLDAITYEINQSLYLFSQKTKSELNRFFFLTESGFDGDRLGQALGRDIIPLRELLDEHQSLTVLDLPFLNGLLQPKAFGQAEFFSVTQRQVKRSLAWEPIQWFGVALGCLLLLVLIGNQALLSGLLNQEHKEGLRIRQQVLQTDGAALVEFESALDRALTQVQQPASGDVIRRLTAGLPAAVWIREVALTLEAQPALILEADIKVDHVDLLKPTLVQMVERLKVHFESARGLSVNNIDIHRPAVDGRGPGAYRIVLKLELI